MSSTRAVPKKKGKKKRVNVSSHVKKNAGILRLLSKSKGKVLKDIIRACDASLVKAVCECAANVLKGRVPLSSNHKGRLRRFAKHLRTITNKKVSIRRRKKIIQEGGFLPALLAPLAAILGGVATGLA